MTPSPVTVWTLAALVGATSLIAGGRAYRNAAKQSTHASHRLHRIAEQASELRRLQAGLPAWAQDSSTKADAGTKEALAQRVSAVIAAAGLAPNALASLSPESSASNSTERSSKSPAQVLRKRAVLTFGCISLPQLGRFLAAWREREPSWTVTSIDATPITHGERMPADKNATPVAPGGDLPARVIVTVEKLSVHRTGNATPRLSRLPGPAHATPSASPSAPAPPTPARTTQQGGFR